MKLQFAIDAINHVLVQANIPLSVDGAWAEPEPETGTVFVHIPNWEDVDAEIVAETRQAAMGWMPAGTRLEIITKEGEPCKKP